MNKDLYMPFRNYGVRSAVYAIPIRFSLLDSSQMKLLAQRHNHIGIM